MPEPSVASVEDLQPCPKCSPGLSRGDVAVSYHPHRSYCDPHSRFTFNSREDEHLHYTCRKCGYDWTGDVAS